MLNLSTSWMSSRIAVNANRDTPRYLSGIVLSVRNYIDSQIKNKNKLFNLVYEDSE